jgi:ABC-2 type transport system permease protein
MKKSLLIAGREWKERLTTRSFLLLAFLGPALVLGMIYLLFVYGGESQVSWNVLVADPSGLMQNRVLTENDGNVKYTFADGYLEMEEFRDAKKYQKFDALFEIHQNVLNNKNVHVFYREKPSVRLQTRVQFDVERRLEEVVASEVIGFSVEKYRKIKQPLNVAFHDVYDPNDISSDLRAWAGYFYGAIIFVFISLFGMTILRSVSREKSNRIVEVLLASVSPRQLMFGKIMGIGLSALVQFVIWGVIVSAGLYLMRETLFPDLLDPANVALQSMTTDGNGQQTANEILMNREYNAFMEIVYKSNHVSVMLPFFVCFFIGGYFFYGAFFAAVGSTMGSESDGQQFVFPIIFILCFALYSGYYVMGHPDTNLAQIFHYLPFTSPVVVMVKLSQGYGPGEVYQIYLSLILLFIAAALMLIMASRLYKNGILQFGHRLRLSLLFKWMKQS